MPTTEKVLCVVSHPDDETLGCGATIAKHCVAGDAVSILVLADGVGSRAGPVIVDGALRTSGFVSALRERHGSFRKATEILGTNDVWLYQFADNRMDSLDLLTVVQHIEKHLQRFNPTIVYTHDGNDMNVDHRVTHEAVKVACRPQPGCEIKQLYFFEVPCSSAWGGGFAPDHYVDTTETHAKKLAACACYTTEMRDPPHPRSLENITTLAKHRGATVGFEYAEAFVTGRSTA